MSKIKKADWTNFNSQQLKAIELLAQPNQAGLIIEEIAERVGVSKRSIYRWKSDPNFMAAVTEKTLEGAGAHLPVVLAAHMEAVKNHNVRAIELYYKLMGLLSDKVEFKDVTEPQEAPEDIVADIQRLKELLGKNAS